MPQSSILFQNEGGTVVLLDLPRTIEEAQLLSNELGSGTHLSRRLLSAAPPEATFATPEPRPGQLIQNASSPSAQVAELMTLAVVDNALDQVRAAYTGPWCLPRVLRDEDTRDRRSSGPNKSMTPSRGTEQTTAGNQVYIPKEARYLNGSIESHREALLYKNLQFKLVVLDPPWPNRSARRKTNNYATAVGLEGVRDLLSLVPVPSCLSSDGLAAVWVTNAPRFADLLTSTGGIFEKWGLELVGEWTWLKVTTRGEPIYAVESAWRKPWERLLIARRRGSSTIVPGGERRVIITVPDIHSRKPNIRGLFNDSFGPGYPALEVFARNLTAGWWSWGDETLRFQACQYWADAEDC